MKGNEKRTKTLTVTLNIEAIKRIEKLVEGGCGNNPSDFTRIAVTKYMEEREKANKFTSND